MVLITIQNPNLILLFIRSQALKVGEVDRQIDLIRVGIKIVSQNLVVKEGKKIGAVLELKVESLRIVALTGQRTCLGPKYTRIDLME